jgi:dihydroorotase-like cyclic amidohydrolase
MLVLPGVVDVHTHTRVATDAEPDRFFQDSVAAAFGGTTTFLSFNNPGTG